MILLRENVETGANVKMCRDVPAEKQNQSQTMTRGIHCLHKYILLVKANFKLSVLTPQHTSFMH